MALHVDGTLQQPLVLLGERAQPLGQLAREALLLGVQRRRDPLAEAPLRAGEGGDGEQAWRPMLVQAIAKQIAADGGIGIAGPVLQEMIRMQEKRA